MASIEKPAALSSVVASDGDVGSRLYFARGGGFGAMAACHHWHTAVVEVWPTLLRRVPLWPQLSAWRRCACGTAGGPRRRSRTAIGQGWQACCSSGIGRALRPSAAVRGQGAAGTPCALDSCSGLIRAPSGPGVCRQLRPRVFPDGRCCRWAGGRGVPASANRSSRRSGLSGF